MKLRLVTVGALALVLGLVLLSLPEDGRDGGSAPRAIARSTPRPDGSQIFSETSDAPLHKATPAPHQGLRPVTDDSPAGEPTPAITADRARIRGRVIDADTRKGISGALVQLLTWEGAAATARTDDEGRFVFTPVVPRQFELTAIKQGYLYGEPDEETGEFYSFEPMIFDAGEHEIEMALHQSPGLTATAVDRHGNPLPQRAVTVEVIAGKRGDDPVSKYFQSMTDDDGRLFIPTLDIEVQLRTRDTPVIDAHFSFECEGFADVTLETTLQTQNAVADLGTLRFLPEVTGTCQLTVRDGSPIVHAQIFDDKGFHNGYATKDGIVRIFGLSRNTPFITVVGTNFLQKRIDIVDGRLPASAVLEPGGRVSGTVTDIEGHPVRGVRLFLVAENELGTPRKVADTDNRGCFELQGIPPGTRTLSIECDPLLFKNKIGSADPGGEPRKVSPGDQGLHFVVTRKIRIRLRLLKADSGDEITGPVYLGLTDTKGRTVGTSLTEREIHLMPGTYSLTAAISSHFIRDAPLQVAPDDDGQVMTFKLAAPRSP